MGCGGRGWGADDGCGGGGGEGGGGRGGVTVQRGEWGGGKVSGFDCRSRGRRFDFLDSGSRRLLNAHVITGTVGDLGSRD